MISNANPNTAEELVMEKPHSFIAVITRQKEFFMLVHLISCINLTSSISFLHLDGELLLFVKVMKS